MKKIFGILLLFVSSLSATNVSMDWALNLESLDLNQEPPAGGQTKIKSQSSNATKLYDNEKGKKIHSTGEARVYSTMTSEKFVELFNSAKDPEALIYRYFFNQPKHKFIVNDEYNIKVVEVYAEILDMLDRSNIKKFLQHSNFIITSLPYSELRAKFIEELLLKKNFDSILGAVAGADIRLGRIEECDNSRLHFALNTLLKRAQHEETLHNFFSIIGKQWSSSWFFGHIEGVERNIRRTLRESKLTIDYEDLLALLKTQIKDERKYPEGTMDSYRPDRRDSHRCHGEHSRHKDKNKNATKKRHRSSDGKKYKYSTKSKRNKHKKKKNSDKKNSNVNKEFYTENNHEEYEMNIVQDTDIIDCKNGELRRVHANPSFLKLINKNYFVVFHPDGQWLESADTSAKAKVVLSFPSDTDGKQNLLSESGIDTQNLIPLN